MRTRRVVLALALVVLGLVFAAPSGAQAFDHNPILFVHGIEGSGAQFESQKMRFISNGYPVDWFDEVDYNSTRAAGDKTEVNQQIDDAIAGLQQRTGKAQVDVVAHSLGTTVMQAYLTDATLGAQRRANVGHYINVDGQSQNPGVPTLAVWAGSTLWWVLLCSVVAWLRGRVSTTALLWVNRVSGAALVLFGALAVISALRP